MFPYTVKYNESESDIQNNDYYTKYTKTAKTLSICWNSSKLINNNNKVLFCCIYKFHNSYVVFFVMFESAVHFVKNCSLGIYIYIYIYIYRERYEEKAKMYRYLFTALGLHKSDSSILRRFNLTRPQHSGIKTHAKQCAAAARCASARVRCTALRN